MTYLDEILARRTAAVARMRADARCSRIREAAFPHPKRDRFSKALLGPAPAIVAEFKRRSPSAGPIRVDADAAETAKGFARGGAVAVSVLTEPEFFGANLGDLRAVRDAVEIPVLCKDFIVDDWQIREAAAAGADAVLLIVAALDQQRLREFIAIAASAGMDALVEIHDETEGARALAAGAYLIGVNNRDLRTFAVDLDVAPRVRGSLPSSVITVAESGYRTHAQVERCLRAGFDGVLCGAELMLHADPAAALVELRGGTAACA